MKIASMLVTVALAGLAPAAAQNSPFSAAPLARSGGVDDSATPTLGDVMLLTQLRHIKVWFAGRTSNWRLLQHETVALQDTLIRAALLYQGIPVEEVTKIDKPVVALIEAANEKNTAKFQTAYASLNAACNSCHKAGGVEYIRIQTPSTSPFSDQGAPETSK